MPFASTPPLPPPLAEAAVLMAPDAPRRNENEGTASFLTSDSVPWAAWGRRLRQLDIRLASLPHQWLDEADEAERMRLHGWLAIQQGFIADLAETVRLREAHTRPDQPLQMEETLLLREIARFLQETDDAIAQGKQRFS